jgi:hypothetical protein
MTRGPIPQGTATLDRCASLAMTLIEGGNQFGPASSESSVTIG